MVSHIKALLFLPVTVLIVIPGVILTLTTNARGIWDWEFPPGIPGIAGGCVLIIPGLYLFASSVLLFARVGRGTLAPWEPPRELVVAGIYQYTRNPMISGVLLILLGESALFGSVGVVVWCAFFFTGNSIYFRLSEEPALIRRFGEDYLDYRRNVPRWLPRLSPWTRSNSKDRGPESGAK